MVEADEKDRHRPRTVGQAPDRIRHPLDRDCLQTSLIEVFFLQKHTGKTVCRIHFRRCQDDTPHAVVRADINLMAFRHLHPHMDDVPGSVNGSVEFQSPGKGFRKRSITDPDSRSDILRRSTAPFSRCKSGRTIPPAILFLRQYSLKHIYTPGPPGILFNSVLQTSGTFLHSGLLSCHKFPFLHVSHV